MVVVTRQVCRCVYTTYSPVEVSMRLLNSKDTGYICFGIQERIDSTMYLNNKYYNFKFSVGLILLY